MPVCNLALPTKRLFESIGIVEAAADSEIDKESHAPNNKMSERMGIDSSVRESLPSGCDNPLTAQQWGQARDQLRGAEAVDVALD